MDLDEWHYETIYCAGCAIRSAHALLDVKSSSPYAPGIVASFEVHLVDRYNSGGNVMTDVLSKSIGRHLSLWHTVSSPGLQMVDIDPTEK